ncbi:hypothetical protein PCH_Pc12g04810 [Penicillium rubens Wisconsin 54-1255]|uniref:Uncharacterized protein n=1 Tax=Penicillium rubens (strain ATCC 28089 / DSM 1075 / NRRL 1951 / Wisconsin 54-1255) TaxID=500485 RepID=B6GYJ1_PENRW|nr:hypothetical protein PCH_Pc12g04810 [Penicillium rubens Wisconsin 54-1255]
MREEEKKLSTGELAKEAAKDTNKASLIRLKYIISIYYSKRVLFSRKKGSKAILAIFITFNREEEIDKDKKIINIKLISINLLLLIKILKLLYISINSSTFLFLSR